MTGQQRDRAGREAQDRPAARAAAVFSGLRPWPCDPAGHAGNGDATRYPSSAPMPAPLRGDLGPQLARWSRAPFHRPPQQCQAASQIAALARPQAAPTGRPNGPAAPAAAAAAQRRASRGGGARRGGWAGPVRTPGRAAGRRAAGRPRLRGAHAPRGGGACPGCTGAQQRPADRRHVQPPEGSDTEGDPLGAWSVGLAVQLLQKLLAGWAPRSPCQHAPDALHLAGQRACTRHAGLHPCAGAQRPSAQA